MIYFIDVPERHYAMYEVEADSHWEALQELKNNRGQYSPIANDYSDEGDFRDWRVCDRESMQGMLEVDEAESQAKLIYPREAKGMSK